jgi:hypothetical protein
VVVSRRSAQKRKFNVDIKVETTHQRIQFDIAEYKKGLQTDTDSQTYPELGPLPSGFDPVEIRKPLTE